MNISHIALWTSDIERSKDFYVRYFGGVCGAKYENRAKGFHSYFVSFGEGGALEIMKRNDIIASAPVAEHLGWTHLAITAGDRSEVSALTERLRQDGYKIVGEPRVTGDGYYESVVLDPDGNKIEIVAVE